MERIDPRIVKTKKKLTQALMDLLGTKRIAEISVKDITNQAQITRGTFYLHYIDKQDFVQQFIKSFIDRFFKEVRLYRAGTDTSMLSLNLIFDHVSKNEQFYKYILEEKEDCGFKAIFQKQLHYYLEDYLAKNQIDWPDQIPKTVVLNFFCHSLFGLILHWIEEGLIYANHFMAKNFYDLLNSELFRELELNRFFVVYDKQLKGNYLIGQ